MATSTEPLTYDRANAAQRFVRRFASSGPGSWIFARVAHHLDKPIYRATDGSHTAASLLAGLPILMLTTTGAKSGKRRVVPVVVSIRIGRPASNDAAVWPPSVAR